MNVLITGACGFVGSTLATSLRKFREGLIICGVDNLMRPGSEVNRRRLRAQNIDVIHGDIRLASDVEVLPKADWVIDAAANPSVLAGVAGRGSSRQLFEHNLASLGNILEYCRAHTAGLILLSTSRVFSIPALTSLPLAVRDGAFHLDDSKPLPTGISKDGIDASFSTSAPISLYGGTKLSSEIIALEYSAAFNFPIWINRCGVLAGAGQFGTPDQGIFSYWLHAHHSRRPLRYIGFNGSGYQVRDAFHPRDLAALVDAQWREGRCGGRRIYTAGGGRDRAMSLSQLTAWCDHLFGVHKVERDLQPRLYDLPWIVMSNADASADFGWHPQISLGDLLEEIARHAENNPDWLELSGQ